ncbi:Organic hydroperoxide reductase OsmC/OhrA [Hydrobacter penzbergensis]|jgi:organic hydroperoxide reductase OsmC/OhrA|uniref:Organic hydroperoxide reductase OsmC/OhrA n=1 Tax=Hydrobacter penzbergensis TaxID=1235997 RepID=A0A8X8IIC9_9BACT|nr:OsmC family protein [Hydrobacter penzbergensis]MBN8719629.1 OsmC family protein [Sediminibacterium magnilacihabitans]PQV60360.1 organic hydroperoxide reductase OsmC/OhrA [Sediminibacterium magnilacihabitans]SDX21787.1 Organic hydroperoxide reductase OsmC/OhrA [Hydrobacter penzbergensis]
MKQHHYTTSIQWTGNNGSGTDHYRNYERSHTISVEGKAAIAASSDPSFRGDKTKYNPEELLVASISSCHMLWYLHLCSEAGVIVTDYTDNATGIMAETADGGGHFVEVILHPTVTVKEASMIGKANGLHEKAHKLCFIANSVNFPVKHQPVTKVV